MFSFFEPNQLIDQVFELFEESLPYQFESIKKIGKKNSSITLTDLENTNILKKHFAGLDPLTQAKKMLAHCVWQELSKKADEFQNDKCQKDKSELIQHLRETQGIMLNALRINRHIEASFKKKYHFGMSSRLERSFKKVIQFCEDKINKLNEEELHLYQVQLTQQQRSMVTEQVRVPSSRMGLFFQHQLNIPNILLLPAQELRVLAEITIPDNVTSQECDNADIVSKRDHILPLSNYYIREQINPALRDPIPSEIFYVFSEKKPEDAKKGIRAMRLYNKVDDARSYLVRLLSTPLVEEKENTKAIETSSNNGHKVRNGL